MLINGDDKNNKLKGTSEEDSIYGLAGKDKLEGDRGNDYMTGGLGNDELLGGKGDDFLDGGKDSDKLIEGDGNDILNGYGSFFEYLPEKDILTGGKGADTFRLGQEGLSWYGDFGVNGKDAYGTITDFNYAEGDTIELWRNGAIPSLLALK